MNWKIQKQVPKGIQYLSNWEDFSLKNFPNHSILHKQLPGCGFTEFALTCPEPVVLCSPRKMLMQNKKDQHGDDVYLVVNEFEIDTDIDEDVSKPISPKSLENKDKYFMEILQKQTEGIQNLYTHLYQEISQYMKRMNQQGKPVKIIVTYDSTYLVKQIFESMGICDQFYFCVDEFQSILDDSRFKSTTEIEFLSVLQGVKNAIFVSATPMLDKYLEQIQEFRFLPYFELDWKTLDSSRIKKPDLKVRTMSSIGSKMSEIIQSYLDKKFERVIVDRSGQLVEIESREAVFYVNSVNHIINIIKKMELTPEQCNILCSDTPYNQSRIDKKLGKKKGYKIGTVPLKGQPHKMFTFCTRTVYLGADFYSTCARSFIFSDSNTDCLSIDISGDLYQILGRQRDILNPWKNSAEFFYRTTCDTRKKTWEEFHEILTKKVESTNSLLRSFDRSLDLDKEKLAERYQYIAKSLKYREDYIAVNKNKITGELKPVFNNLVMINDQKTFDIQQVDYADRFSVFTTLTNELQGYEFESSYIDEFFYQYDQLTTWVDKIHYIVDYILENSEKRSAIIGNLSDSDKIKQQLITLGPERIKGLGYNITKIKQAMGITIFSKIDFISDINSEFIVGCRYTKKYIKEKLGEIYKKMDYKGTPKATDLEEWFNLKPLLISNPSTKKRENGFEIISKK